MSVPSLAPIGPVSALCFGCGNRMRLEVKRMANGKLVYPGGITLYCDTCKYGHEPSMQHVSGMTVPYVIPQKRGLEAAANEAVTTEQKGGGI